jgi:hypothetical protein
MSLEERPRGHLCDGPPMYLDRDVLDARRQAIETRLSQIVALPRLDQLEQEVCRAEVEQLLLEQDSIEYALGLDGPHVNRAARSVFPLIVLVSLSVSFFAAVFD